MQGLSFTPVFQKHLEALRGTTEYKLLLNSVVNACSTLSPEVGLSSAADAILRPIASDLSRCSSDGRIIIFHMLIVHGQG